jgi:hypothetical protein
MSKEVRKQGELSITLSVIIKYSSFFMKYISFSTHL